MNDHDGDVSREIARFDPALSIEDAWTPPASWYIDPGVLAHEARTVFARSWLCAVRGDQVAAPGTYATAGCLERQWVVVRDQAGALRAFHNVCRHHAALVMAGAGSCEQLVCPYHGWSYDLTGRLLRAPRSGGIRGFDRDDFALHALGVEAWDPLVLVHARHDAAPFTRDVGDLREQLALDGLHFAQRREYLLRCNWKVFVDNYLDGGYHVAIAHRGLAANLALDSYTTETFARHSIQSCAAPAGAHSRLGQRALYAWIHPNLMLNRYGPVLDTNLVLPVSATETRVVIDWYFDREHAADPAFVAEAIDASERVQQEDIALCESVQRGLMSGAFDRGRYAPRLETGAHHFHRLLAADLRA